jgi:bifunctional non-homologous end joining protein LigD
MTQLASISQDPWFSKVTDPWHADQVAIDLDPGDEAGFDKVLDVARWVKEELDTLGIPALPKTSGSSGLHIYIPLPKGTTYESGQLLCHVVATLVSQKHPKVATIERTVRRRPRGTVYVDYLQNILGKTLASAFRCAHPTSQTSRRRSPGRKSRVAWPEFHVRTALPGFADPAISTERNHADVGPIPCSRGAPVAPTHWRRR